jgi:hypothetical protein
LSYGAVVYSPVGTWAGVAATSPVGLVPGLGIPRVEGFSCTGAGVLIALGANVLGGPDGLLVGANLGAIVLGGPDGLLVAANLGAFVLGGPDGLLVGINMGVSVNLNFGANVGLVVGAILGASVGLAFGAADGLLDCTGFGACVTFAFGASDGLPLGVGLLGTCTGVDVFVIIAAFTGVATNVGSTISGARVGSPLLNGLIPGDDTGSWNAGEPPSVPIIGFINVGANMVVGASGLPNKDAGEFVACDVDIGMFTGEATVGTVRKTGEGANVIVDDG